MSMGEIDPFANLASQTEQLDGLLQGGLVTHGVARAVRRLNGEVAIMQADAIGRREFATNPPDLQPGLHVGCGRNIIPGFTNLDIFANEGVDVVCDAREGLPFDDDQFEETFSEHMLEHIDYPYSAKLVLGEMVRVTKQGGRVVVGVPDASVPIRAYADGDEEYFDELRERWYGKRDKLEHYTHPVDLVRLVFADEDDDKEYTPHLWGYDESSLTALMEEAGLVDIQPWPLDPKMSLEKRWWGSVYLQGTKQPES